MLSVKALPVADRAARYYNLIYFGSFHHLIFSLLAGP